MYLETAAQVREMFAHAPYDELERAIESAWCDYTLAGSIADSLRARPEEAFWLAKSALNSSHLVIQYTALLVLQTISADQAQADAAKPLLREHIEQAKQGKFQRDEPAWHYWEETLAKIEGRHDAYLTEKHAQYRHLEPHVAQITNGKKANRLNAIQMLEQTKDPYFTKTIARALDDAEDKNVKAALNALATIRGFDAIPQIAGMLRGFWSRQALETLAALGDRSALTYIFETLENSAAPSYILDLLPQYGHLAIQPLIAALKKFDHPEEYKNGLASVVAILRCDALAEALLVEAEQDADLSEKIVHLLEKMYPKQLKKPSAKKSLTTIAPIVFSAFGGRTFEIGARGTFAITPEGKSLASLMLGKGVTVLDTRTGERRGSLAMNGSPHAMSLSPNGAYLLTATYTDRHEYLAQVWKWGEWEQSLAALAHPLEINTLTMSWDARFLLIGDTEKVRVVECGTWRDVFTFTGHPVEPVSQPFVITAGNTNYRSFTFLQALPNSSFVLIGDWLGWLSVLEMETWRETAWLKSDSWAPKFAELSADGSRLVHAGHAGIHVWDTTTWQTLYSAVAPTGFDYMTLTPDGRYLVAEKSKKIRFFDMQTWKEAFAFDSAPVGQLLVTPDSRELFLSSSFKIKAWSLALLYSV
ncbi:WD40 repeat, subgroup [Candidatus Moduliflexus flocculans]|uniref:WD40 repeat, subgroup n=1 Tax=Candidatus Moduliflexus flocculans TaxID=1499966 RepID=A0A0S6VQ15_9BACT|nr:WD40 repeat, subgroup [Candidatus Moduliflexus flocculans]